MSKRPLCVLVDDDLSNLDTLKTMVERTQLLEVEKAYTKPINFLTESAQLKSKIVFLDIEMPEITGLELTKKLIGKIVIIVSGHKEFAAEAYDLDVVDFVKKPITEERLKRAIGKAFEKISLSNDSLFVRTQVGKEKLLYDRIALIRTHAGESRDKEVFLVNPAAKSVIKKMNFIELMSQLDKRRFIQISHRAIINRSYIKVLPNKDEITLDVTDPSGRVISETLTDKFRDEFRAWFGS